MKRIMFLIGSGLVLVGVNQSNALDQKLGWIEKEGIKAIGVQAQDLKNWGADYGGEKVTDPYPWIDKYVAQIKEGGFNVLFLGNSGKDGTNNPICKYTVKKAHDAGLHVWQFTIFAPPTFQYETLKNFNKDHYSHAVRQDGIMVIDRNIPVVCDLDENYWNEVYIPLMKEWAEFSTTSPLEGIGLGMELGGQGHHMRPGERMTCFCDKCFQGFLDAKNLGIDIKALPASLRFAWLKKNNLALEYFKYLEEKLISLIHRMQSEVRKINPNIYFIVAADYWEPPADCWYHWWGDAWLKGLDEKDRPFVLMDTGSTHSHALRNTPEIQETYVIQDIARFRHLGINPFYVGLVWAEGRRQYSPADLSSLFLSYFKATYGCHYFGNYDGPIFIPLPGYPNYELMNKKQLDFDQTQGDLGQFWESMKKTNKLADELMKDGTVLKTREAVRKKAWAIPAESVVPDFQRKKSEKQNNIAGGTRLGFGDDFDRTNNWAAVEGAVFSIKGDVSSCLTAGYLQVSPSGQGYLSSKFSDPIDVSKYPFMEIRLNLDNMNTVILILYGKGFYSRQFITLPKDKRAAGEYWHTCVVNLNTFYPADMVYNIQIYPNDYVVNRKVILDYIKFYQPDEEEFLRAKLTPLIDKLTVSKEIGRPGRGMEITARLYSAEFLDQKMAGLMELYLYDGKHYLERKKPEEQIYEKGIPVRLTLLNKGHQAHKHTQLVKIYPSFNWTDSCYLVIDGGEKLKCVGSEKPLENKTFDYNTKIEGLLWFEKGDIKPGQKVALHIENFIQDGGMYIGGEATNKPPIVLNWVQD